MQDMYLAPGLPPRLLSGNLELEILTLSRGEKEEIPVHEQTWASPEWEKAKSHRDSKQDLCSGVEGGLEKE